MRVKRDSQFLFKKIMMSTKKQYHAQFCFGVFGRYTKKCYPNAQHVGATNSGTLTLPYFPGFPYIRRRKNATICIGLHRNHLYAGINAYCIYVYKHVYQSEQALGTFQDVVNPTHVYGFVYACAHKSPWIDAETRSSITHVHGGGIRAHK